MKSLSLPAFSLVKFRFIRFSRLRENLFLIVGAVALGFGLSSVQAAASLTWTGAVNQNWTTAITTNWLNGVTPASFANGDAVIFDDTATGTGAVTVAINAADVSPASTTFNNATRDYTLNGPYGIISGNLVKNGAGKLTLNAILGSNVGTTLNGGTLELGGNNRLPVNKTFMFGGTSTLNLGGYSQSTANLVTNFQSTTTTYTVTNGSFGVTDNSLNIKATGSTVGTSVTLDLSGLSSFTFNKSTGSVSMGAEGTNAELSGNLKLSLTSNTLTAANVQVGAFNGNNTTQKATLTLGAANLIQAGGFYVGAGANGDGQRADGQVIFAAGLTNPTFTLRGTTGGTSRSAIIIASSQAGGQNGTSSMNLNGATVDILASTMTIGRYKPGSGSAAITGSFLFDAGTVDAQTIILGQRAGGIAGSPPPIQAIGTITQGGGIMKVQTLTLGDSTATASSGIKGEYILNGGSLYAAAIQAGTNTNTSASSVRQITWNNGTIRNYDAATDLTFNGVAGGNGALGIVLASTGTHTFLADAARAITLNANVVISGIGGTLVKDGAGVLVLNGTNTYTGSTLVSAGTLVINGSIAASSGVSVAAGATLGGSGAVSAISGAGRVGPGNSPGILTASSVDGTAGLDFAFEITALNPAYGSAAASLNDVLRLTSATPFASALGAGNTVTVDFSSLTLGIGQIYRGGFYADHGDFFADISGANFQFVGADGFLILVSTAAQTADFGGGNVNGWVTQFEVAAIPEPASILLLAGGLMVAFFMRRRARN